jgi:hypothetical protein
MNTKLLIAIGFGTACLLPAADAPKQKAMATKTERLDFPAGGALRFKNSVGVLTVEAWDQPDVEITTIESTKVDLDAHGREKATHSLERVNVTSERHGDELVITTNFPHHRPFRVPYLFSGETGFDPEYRIKAPANARIIAAHTLGQVNIDGFASDIQVTVAQGQILLHLPEEGQYNIQARSDFGSVNSDFSEPEKRDWWVLGHRSVDKESTASHKLNLKVGFGDIVILKSRIPKYLELAPAAQKTEGL